MDYEKKYKEALEWMKDVYPTLQGAAKKEAEKHFPEIVESEDERIRKYLINQYKGDGCLCGNNFRISYEDIRAWLERQGEKKPADKVEPKFKVGDVIRLKGSAAEYKIKKVTDTTYYTNGWSCGIERCEEDYELVEQKPTAWSEEDELMLMSIIQTLKLTNGAAQMKIDFLKSLKERVGCEANCTTMWKPSKEQIKQLEWIAKQNKDNMIGKELMSLYQDLKKLREE